MWRKVIIALFLMLPASGSAAQSAEELELIMKFTGSESPENMDAYEVERLSFYIQHPLKLNSVSRSRLLSSGLFSSYQVASILDYRARHGDIMSLSELSSVDGFQAAAVDAIAPFISLEGGNVTGVRNAEVLNDLALKVGVKETGQELSWSCGTKYRCRIREPLTITMAASRPYIFSGSLLWEPVGRPFRIIAGDFNARFGQGLALWNGMSMTGLSKTSSFFRSSSGLSSSWSFTGSSAHTGIAGEYSFSRIRVSAFMSFPESKSRQLSCLPAVNVGWYGGNMSLSATHYTEFQPLGDGIDTWYIPDMKTSADLAMCIDGTDLFSEITYDWVNVTAAALAGVIFPWGENLRIAAHMRFYPAGFNPSRSAAPRAVSKCSNEYGISLCGEYMPRSGRLTGSLSVDSAYLPEGKDGQEESVHVRMMADAQVVISDGLTMKLRLSERFRTWGQPFKTDLRTDMIWSSGRFSVTGRFNVLEYVDIGWLGFLECGYKYDSLSVYLKQVYFDVANWEDRIYAYERSAPGSFSVPAFYGQGHNTSFMVSWKYARWGRLYAKGTFTYGQKKKPGKAGLDLQMVFSF